MLGRRRVIITGMGAVCAAGIGVELFWRACVEGRSCLRPIRSFDARPYGVDRGGEVVLPDGPTQAGEDSGDGGGSDPASGFALLAASEALDSAGIDRTSLPAGSGIVLGTCLGGARVAFDWLSERRAPRRGLLSASLAAPTLRLADSLSVHGPVMTVSTACASGTGAIALAADCIRRGESDLMLAGGADALSSFVVSGFSQLRALASGPVRPFDRRRDGLALGEGAGILVLEECESARRRGASLLAEVLGSGRAGDANHMTGPSPTGDGVVRAITSALRQARLPAERVGFISAHGTGTSFNDWMETIAFKRVFAEGAFKIPVNAIKPIVGHTLGASGALEAIMCVRAMREGILPPTINYEERDPECDLDYVPNAARRHSARAAISSSSAFCGNNVSLVLGAA